MLYSVTDCLCLAVFLGLTHIHITYTLSVDLHAPLMAPIFCIWVKGLLRSSFLLWGSRKLSWC